MRINRNNYEAFLLDQLEGRLSAEKQRELEDFLLLHPDCAGQLSELEPWALARERVPFHAPDLLKKKFPDPRSVPGNHNFDMFSIARMEGDLSDFQIRAHQALLEADDQKAKQWMQWQLTRLPVEPVLFAAKDLLRHKRPFSGWRIWIPLISAAAAVALLFVLLSRTPELPQGQSFLPTQEERINIQEKQIELEPDRPGAEAASVEERTSPAQPDPAGVTKLQAAVLPADKGSPPSPGSSAILKAAQPDQVEPFLRAFNSKQFNRFSMAGEADPDRIEALPLAPLTVPVGSMTVAQLSELGIQGIIEEYAQEKDLSLWKIAHAGINGINRLAGSDISLMASRDEEGEISGFQFKSKRFSLTRPILRDE